MENIKEEWLTLLQETNARTSWTEELNSSDDSGASEWTRLGLNQTCFNIRVPIFKRYDII